MVKNKVIAVILVLLILIALGNWWYNSAQQNKGLEEYYYSTFTEKVLPNIKGTVPLSVFRERIYNNEIETVYRQWAVKEYTAILKYYVKFREEDGYYVVFVPQARDSTIVDMHLSQYTDAAVYVIPVPEPKPWWMFWK